MNTYYETSQEVLDAINNRREELGHGPLTMEEAINEYGINLVPISIAQVQRWMNHFFNIEKNLL